MSHFAKRHYERIAEALQEAYGSIDYSGPSPGLTRAGIDKARNELADVFARDNGSFDRERFERACVPGANVRARSAKPYQPKTGERCSCRPGVERDNCPACEGTGERIDFRALRARA